MVELYFVPSKLPRTWTRQQWKEAYRWVRVTRKKLNEATAKRLAWLQIYGTTHPELVHRAIDDMVNPPLLMGPGMEDK